MVLGEYSSCGGFISQDDIKDGIRFYGHPVVNMVVLFCLSEYVEILQGVHHMALASDVNSIHDVFYWSNGMTVFYKVLCEARLPVPIFKISEMFLKSDFEWAPCLTCILLVTCWAG